LYFFYNNFALFQKRYLVGIRHGKGVSVIKQIPKMNRKMAGKDYASIVNTKIFNKHLAKTRQLIQDNDPVQNSKVARSAFARQKIKLVPIPSKSPDINVIENLFNDSKQQLAKQALQQNITKESRTQFASRIEEMLASYSVNRVNKLVDSLPNRMKLLVQKDGIRLRY